MNFLTAEQKKILFYGLMTALTLTYCAFYWLPIGKEAFPAFSSLLTVQFLFYAACAYFLKHSDPKLKWILLAAVISRLVVIYTHPVLEDDYWRYLWDGRVWAEGINPYLFKPMDQALDHLNTDYRIKIGWKQYGTIYPPVSIFIFKVAHLISPDSLLALKFIFILFDLCTGLLIAKFFIDSNQSAKWSALYFLNPLVLKEIANSAHLDAIVVFFTVLAVYLLRLSFRSSARSIVSLAAWFFLAVAFASKLFPISLAPIFFKLDKKRWLGVGVFAATSAILYLPMIAAGRYGLNGTEAFARHWVFNASLYRVFQKVGFYFQTHLNMIWETNVFDVLLRDSLAAKALSLLAFAFFVLYRTHKKLNYENLQNEILYTLGALLLLSPVVNAWYVLWLIPFACLSFSIPWIGFSYLVVASYSWWYSQDLAFYLRWLEYLILFLLLSAQWIKKESLTKSLN